MSKSFGTITGDVSKALGTLRKEIPETMQGFNTMSKAALTPGALSALEKELIALPSASPAVAMPVSVSTSRHWCVSASAVSSSWKRSASVPIWAAARP